VQGKKFDFTYASGTTNMTVCGIPIRQKDKELRYFMEFQMGCKTV